MPKKKQQPKTERKQKTRGLALPDELFERLTKRAHDDGVSASLTARKAIEIGLDKLDAIAMHMSTFGCAS